MKICLQCPACDEVTEVPLAIAANRTPGGYGRRTPIMCTDPECGEEIPVTAVMVDNILIKSIETLEEAILSIYRPINADESITVSQLKVEL